MASFFTIEVDTSNPYPEVLGWVSLLVRPVTSAASLILEEDRAEAALAPVVSATLALTRDRVNLSVGSTASAELTLEEL